MVGGLELVRDDRSLRRERKLGVSENVMGRSRLENVAAVAVEPLWCKADLGALGGLLMEKLTASRGCRTKGLLNEGEASDGEPGEMGLMGR